MGNKYLSYDADRAPKVREMFSRVAARYDLVNDLMSLGLHRRWKREVARRALAGAGPAARVLDLCCGSGDLAFSAERVGAARITGVDFALPMLAVARSRRRASNSRCRFVQADALALPFPDGSFDAITVGYGLRNIADLPAALSEMRRVLAPGGRVAVLDFGKPENLLVRRLYLAYLRVAMPLFGWLSCGDADAYRYIPASLEDYPAQRGVERLMRQAGFASTGHEDRFFGAMGINFGEAPGSR